MIAVLITVGAVAAVVAAVLLLDLASSRRQRRRLALGRARAGSDRRNRDSTANQAAVESSARNAQNVTYGI